LAFASTAVICASVALRAKTIVRGRMRAALK
jgi:hypothetical protein